MQVKGTAETKGPRENKKRHREKQGKKVTFLSSTLTSLEAPGPLSLDKPEDGQFNR